MSKHNYSQYSNKKKSNGKPGAVDGNAVNSKPGAVDGNAVNSKPGAVDGNSKTAPEVKMVVEPRETATVREPRETAAVREPINVKPVQETVDTVSLPETVEGVVVDCARLNVRVEPNAGAKIVDVLDVRTNIKINVAKSNNEWFCVQTASGVEGYCMRKFINAYL